MKSGDKAPDRGTVRIFTSSTASGPPFPRGATDYAVLTSSTAKRSPFPSKGKDLTRSIRGAGLPLSGAATAYCLLPIAFQLSGAPVPGSWSLVTYHMTFGAGNVTAVTFSVNSDAILGGYAEIQLYGRVTLS